MNITAPHWKNNAAPDEIGFADALDTEGVPSMFAIAVSKTNKKKPAPAPAPLIAQSATKSAQANTRQKRRPSLTSLFKPKNKTISTTVTTIVPTDAAASAAPGQKIPVTKKIVTKEKTPNGRLITKSSTMTSFEDPHKLSASATGTPATKGQTKPKKEGIGSKLFKRLGQKKSGTSGIGKYRTRPNVIETANDKKPEVPSMFSHTATPSHSKTTVTNACSIATTTVQSKEIKSDEKPLTSESSSEKSAPHEPIKPRTPVEKPVEIPKAEPSSVAPKSTIPSPAIKRSPVPNITKPSASVPSTSALPSMFAHLQPNPSPTRGWRKSAWAAHKATANKPTIGQQAPVLANQPAPAPWKKRNIISATKPQRPNFSTPASAVHPWRKSATISPSLATSGPNQLLLLPLQLSLLPLLLLGQFLPTPWWRVMM